MKRNLVNQFVKMLLPALAAILAIICALGTFGWFSRSHNVTGKGTNIQTKSVEDLQIFNNTEDVDISKSAVEEITVRLPYNEGSATKLSPTAHGSFTFRVKDASLEATASYDFIYKLAVENDFEKGDNAFNTNDEDERKLALQYINSHLLFFSGYDNDTKLYKGWLQSGEAIRHTAEQNPQEVTVYWVWVDQYKQIFEENSGLIEEKTREEIAAYYGEENAKKMLADGASPAEAYNVADTVIGMTLKYMCFLIEVSKA